MNTQEIANYFRALADEPDLTFLDNTQLGTLLGAAYSEFRRMVMAQDTSYYEISYNTVAPNASSLDLNNILLGQTPTQPRLERIVRIALTDGGTPPTIRRILRPAPTLEALIGGSTFGDMGYFLQNRTLQFNLQVVNPLQIQYVAADSTNWVAGVTAPTYVDDLVATEWGDLIALLAMRQFAIKDFASNPPMSEQLNKRLSDLRRFLSDSRSGNGASYVTTNDDYSTSW